MSDIQKQNNIKKENDSVKTYIGPIYIGDLNTQFINSAQFIISESIKLDENGTATIIRRIEPCIMNVPRGVYEEYINKLSSQMPKIKLSEPKYEAGHRFLPTSLMNCSAYTLDGNLLPLKEVQEFGSTKINISLPITIDKQNDLIYLKLPGYILKVKISQLSRQLDTMWFLQWSHGAIGQTKLYINLIIPNLKHGVIQKIFYNQFLNVEPNFNSSQQSHPFIEFLNISHHLILKKISNIFKTIFSHILNLKNYSNQIKKPKLEAQIFTYHWERSLRSADTFTIHVAYGLRYRKMIFSPVGFILSNIFIIILTILLTEPLTNLIKYIIKIISH